MNDVSFMAIVQRCGELVDVFVDLIFSHVFRQGIRVHFQILSMFSDPLEIKYLSA